MTWEARIKAALHGEVKGGDVAALLAATNPLAGLHQQLEDRRLSTQLDHADREWLVAFELGSVAAPLWLAEALVGIASSFVEAETEQHPDRPADMSPAVHDQCLALLYPVGPMIGELSAMLADQAHPFAFALPATFAAGALTLISIPLPLPAPYLRGLLRGAERTQGAAQAAVNNLAAPAQGATTPAWLTAALRGIGGESAAASTRLEMAQVSAAALLHGGSMPDDTAIHLANDVWSVVDTYLRIGQQVSDPLLLPGAPARRGAVTPTAGTAAPHSGGTPPVLPASSASPPAYQAPVAPPSYHQPAPTPPGDLVQDPARQVYQAPAPAPPAYQAPSPPTVSPPVTPVPAAEPERALPQIGGWPAAAATPTRQVSHAPDAPPPEAPRPQEARPLPQIAPETLPPRETMQQRSVMPRISAPTGVIGPASQPPPITTPAAPLHITPAAPLHITPAAPLHITRDARWMFSSPELRHQLRDAGREDEAERALAAFWEQRSWTVSLAEQAYLDEVAALRSRGAVAVEAHDPGQAPFAPRYRVVAPEVVVRGQRIAGGRSFSHDFAHGGVRVF